MTSKQELTDQQIQRILIKCAIKYSPDEFSEKTLRAVLNRKSKKLEHGDTIEDIFFPFYDEGIITDYEVVSWESHDMWKIKNYINKKLHNKEIYQVNTSDEEEFVFILFDRYSWKPLESVLNFFNVPFEREIIWGRMGEE